MFDVRRAAADLLRGAAVVVLPGLGWWSGAGWAVLADELGAPLVNPEEDAWLWAGTCLSPVLGGIGVAVAAAVTERRGVRPVPAGAAVCGAYLGGLVPGLCLAVWLVL